MTSKRNMAVREEHSAGIVFTPHIKRKRNSNHYCEVAPFPAVANSLELPGIFNGISVEVSNQDAMQRLYESGFYGKGSKSRGAPQFATTTDDDIIPTDEVLVLMPEEAFFLAYILNIMKILNVQNEEMTWSDLYLSVQNINRNFTELLAAYLYLKCKGWIVKSGIKFGGDYIIYKKGPAFYHASFLVILSFPSKNQLFLARNIKGLQRIAETSDKDVLILEVQTKHKDFQIKSILDFETINITETIIQRFNCTTFLQNTTSKLVK